MFMLLSTTFTLCELPHEALVALWNLKDQIVSDILSRRATRIVSGQGRFRGIGTLQ